MYLAIYWKAGKAYFSKRFTSGRRLLLKNTDKVRFRTAEGPLLMNVMNTLCMFSPAAWTEEKKKGRDQTTWLLERQAHPVPQ